MNLVTGFFMEGEEILVPPFSLNLEQNCGSLANLRPGSLILTSSVDYQISKQHGNDKTWLLIQSCTLWVYNVLESPMANLLKHS